MSISTQDAALVTGCAGFIGERVVRQLLDGGIYVVGADNLNDYYDVRLKRHRLNGLLESERFRFVELDIEDRTGVETVFEEYQFNVVYNLAARAGVRASIQNPHVYFSSNVLGSLNLLEAMRKWGVKKYVLASTSSLYAGQAMPFVETLSVNMPISPYAASKKAAEVLAYTYHHLYAVDVSVVRYFTVYGPAGRPDMSILRFIHRIYQDLPVDIYGDGSHARDFTYIDDVAKGTVLAARPLGYEIINLGAGNQPATVLEVARLIEKQLGKKAYLELQPVHAGDMKSTWADISKAERLLEWKPAVELNEGIRQTVRWYRDNLPFSAEVMA